MLVPLENPESVTPDAIISIVLSANCNLSPVQLSSIPVDVKPAQLKVPVIVALEPTAKVPDTSPLPLISIRVAFISTSSVALISNVVLFGAVIF